MTELADVVGYRKFEQRLTRKCQSEVKALVAGLAGMDAIDVRNVLLAGFGRLMQPYVSAMAEFATTWAEDLFAEATEKNPTVAVVDDLDEAAVEASVRWAVGPLFGESGTVEERLCGTAQRLIANAGRSSVVATQSR